MSGVPPGPWGGEPPAVFGAPWHARAFALVVALHERGVFSWVEWAAALAALIGNRPAIADATGDATHHDEPAAPGDEYYRHWLAALEQLVEAKRLGSRGELARLDAAWAAAAERTPHGMAIQLQAGDF